MKRIRVYYGSSTYDTKEMSVLIDYIVDQAKELDIPTETPDEIARMKEFRSKQNIKQMVQESHRSGHYVQGQRR